MPISCYSQPVSHSPLWKRRWSPLKPFQVI
uniref:Uncharacterized protein n=1 Tax=Rhizophora mucronata TaxID=61149 RepID=A0A2P2Q370_RHIMU